MKIVVATIVKWYQMKTIFFNDTNLKIRIRNNACEVS